MTTPVIMLVLMTAPWAAARALASATGRVVDLRAAAAIGLGLLFAFTGLGHFVQADPMAAMLPSWVPGRRPLVHLSGLLEFTIAAGFLVRSTRRSAGWIAAALLVLFFPINVYAAVNRVPMGGHEWGPVYLLIRAPLQAAVLTWTWWFTIRDPEPRRRVEARRR